MTQNVKTIIALTGMMGCGKTTVAKELAALMSGFTRIEMDDIIAQREEMSINDIFVKKGEQYFRNQEAALLKELCESKNLIISMGGGVFLSEENRCCLKEKALSFYLKTDVKTLCERLKHDKSRPLLNSDNLEKRIKEILDIRSETYEKADVLIETATKPAEQIAKEIMEVYKNYGN